MISTFVANLIQVDSSLKAGADRLIIEHSRVTIRSFFDDALDPYFGKYGDLATHARSIKPDIELSISIDILPHNADFDVIRDAVIAASRAGISRFRIQDIGVATFIRDHCPNAHITLAPEIGHHSSDAINIALKFVDCVSVGNEVPITTIQSVEHRNRLEVQVQGPILIQYSYRRYLDGLYQTDTTYDQFASDEEYPGRMYRFYDSPNGTVMFLYFDRCLLKESTQLKGLNLGGWLVDGRGESLSYLSAAITTYKRLWRGDTIDIDDALRKLKDFAGGRPQRPGFFLKNNTDQDRDRELDDAPVIGVVKDSLKGKYTVLEFRSNLECFPDTMSIVSTKKVKKIVPWPVLKDLISGEVVRSVKVGDLVICHWIPGVSSKSVIITPIAEAL